MARRRRNTLSTGHKVVLIGAALIGAFLGWATVPSPTPLPGVEVPDGGDLLVAAFKGAFWGVAIVGVPILVVSVFRWIGNLGKPDAYVHHAGDTLAVFYSGNSTDGAEAGRDCYSAYELVRTFFTDHSVGSRTDPKLEQRVERASNELWNRGTIQHCAVCHEYVRDGGRQQFR